jgi:hypothetical protein
MRKKVDNNKYVKHVVFLIIEKRIHSFFQIEDTLTFHSLENETGDSWSLYYNINRIQQVISDYSLFIFICSSYSYRCLQI